MNPLVAVGGAVPKGQSHWGVIWQNEFFTGFWKLRNPLRDAAVPYLYNKFYGASRFESVWDGVNSEVTPSLTWARRFGNAVYNTQAFPAISLFYPFQIAGANFDNTIQVIADTAGAVYDATGPDTKEVIFAKSAGSVQTGMVAVGNILYMGDGVDLLQYVQSAFEWQTTYTMPQDEFIVDSNGNIQLSLGWATTVLITGVSNGVLTGTLGSVTNVDIGTVLTFAGMSTGTAYLNGYSVAVSTITGSSFTANASIPTSVVGGTGYVSVSGVNGITGGTEPSWSNTLQGVTVDGNNLWSMRGPQVRTWGIQQPASQVNAANVPNPKANPFVWAADTFYWPYPYICDASNNVYELTTAGQTASGIPSFNTTPTDTTTDGTAVWTCIGNGTRVTGGTYATGSVLAVTWTNTNIVSGTDQDGNPTTQVFSTTYNGFFEATVGGTAANIDVSLVAWATGLSSIVQDGSITWTNLGYVVERGTTTAATYFYVDTMVAAVVGNSQLVAISGKILDSNGNVEAVVDCGESGGTAPTWPPKAGAFTVDGSVGWLNGGSGASVGGTAANTGTWVYTYAFGDSVTGDVGPAAPLSAPVMLGSGNYIALQGASSPDPGIDTVYIYRSTQGETTPFLIATIANPIGASTWNYGDYSPDPGNPGSTMNTLIEADTGLNNTPPPDGFIPRGYHLNRIFGFVNNILYYSYGPQLNQIGGNGAFPAANYVEYVSKGQTVWSTSSGIYVFLTDQIQLLAGTTPPFSPSNASPDVGILSPNCFTLNGGTPYILTSDGQVCSIDPTSGVSVIGFPIGNVVNAFSPTASYLTWHVSGTDQRLFISDGATGWFNMQSTPAPESGSVIWSTKANVVGGCSAVISVETSPGVHQLLVGPPSGGGQILARTPGVYQDADTSYPCSWIIGSNVLAQPSEMAEMGFIATDCVRTGSAPTISVLLGEIYGWEGCPPWEVLPRYVNDPPKLPASKTLYSLRWWFNESGKPAWCRHFMLQVSFPAEPYANEMLSMSMFGAIHRERDIEAK